MATKNKDIVTNKKEISAGLGRRRAYRITSIIVVTVLVLVTLGFNVLVNVLDNKLNLHVDMSEQQYYSITEPTKHLLEGLDKDVYVYTLYPAGKEDTRVTELMRTYATYSSRFHFENIDPNENPGFTAEFDPKSEGISSGSMIVTDASHKLYKVFSVFELYSIDASGTYVYAFNAEARVSSAIVYIQTGKTYTVRLLAGHSEFTRKDLSELTVALGGLNYDVQTYDSTTSTDTLDPKYDLLLIASPAVDLSSGEYEKIKAFLGNGGNAIFLMNYVIFDSTTGYTQIILDNLSNFNSLLMMYGLSVNKDYIIGGDSSKLYKRVTGMVPTMNSHNITEPLIKNSLQPVLMDCSSITIAKGDNVKAGPLLETDKNTWAKAVSKTMVADYQDGDAKGPFIIGAVAQNGNSKIALFSASSFILSNADGIERTANQGLIVNTVNTLAGNTNDLNISPKSMISGAMQFKSSAQSLILEILLVAVIPAAIIAAGFVVWIRRRRR